MLWQSLLQMQGKMRESQGEAVGEGPLLKAGITSKSNQPDQGLDQLF